MERNIEEETETEDEKIKERFYYDEHVDVINPKQETVLDAIITSIRGNIYIIRYTESKQEEQISLFDNLILKQWCPGRDFLRFNRLDIQEIESKTWNEGIILNIEGDKLLVRYQVKKTSAVHEELLPKDSKRIAPAGKYTGKYYALNHSSEEINTKLFSKRKFFKLNQKQELKFKEQMQKMHFAIKTVQGDGNCLFRSISDQIYGTENSHDILRAKCMEYIEVEKEFFSKFIDCDFEEYIEMKRTIGVWGDDIELQALSELYSRPIEIYSHSIHPLKTFHENSSTFSRIESLNEDKGTHYPIRLSYHGKAHYNSIIPNDENLSLFKEALISTKPGELEDMMIEKLKNIKKEKENNKETEEIKVNTEQSQLKGRDHFIEKNKEFIDDILEEAIMNEVNAIEDKIPNDDINKALIQSELEEDEKKLFDTAIKMSLENQGTNVNNEQDKNGVDDISYYSISSIQQALEFGFSLNDAILAYSIYGDKPDLILQYLYSMNNYN